MFVSAPASRSFRPHGARPRRLALLGGLVALALLGASPGRASDLLAAELDAARSTDLYLVIDAPGHALAIKARGVVLRTVRLEGAALVLYQQVPSDAIVFNGELPVTWTVSEDTERSYKRDIAPRQLRPYPENPDDVTVQAVQQRTPPEIPEPPSSYRVQLQDGWVLHIGQNIPGSSFGRRLLFALWDGWLTIWGKRPNRQGRLALVVSKEDARRLHHLFNEGTRVLLAPIASGGVTVDGEQPSSAG